MLTSNAPDLNNRDVQNSFFQTDMANDENHPRDEIGRCEPNNLLIKIVFSPHIYDQLPTSRSSSNVSFLPFEVIIQPGKCLRLGRKADKKKDRASNRIRAPNRDDSVYKIIESENSPRPAIDGSMQESSSCTFPVDQNLPENISDTSIFAEMIAFKSKVVSRGHAEMWVGRDGHVYFKDIGSSSGTFLNGLRLSPSGKESGPYQLRNGDIIKLGVDYQDRVEKIYQSISFRVFVYLHSGKPNNLIYYKRVKLALKALLASVNPDAKSPLDARCNECCICLSGIAPFQALFISPCSHCFHYKCIIPLMKHEPMFQCPICRQVANLSANVYGEESEPVDDDAEDNDMWSRLAYLEQLDSPNSGEEIGEGPIVESGNDEDNASNDMVVSEQEALDRGSCTKDETLHRHFKLQLNQPAESTFHQEEFADSESNVNQSFVDTDEHMQAETVISQDQEPVSTKWLATNKKGNINIPHLSIHNQNSLSFHAGSPATPISHSGMQNFHQNAILLRDREPPSTEFTFNDFRPQNGDEAENYLSQDQVEFNRSIASLVMQARRCRDPVKRASFLAKFQQSLDELI